MLDRAEFGRLAAGLSAALTASPGTTEIEINPLRLTSEGLIALDAVIVTPLHPLRGTNMPRPSSNGAVPWPADYAERHTARGLGGRLPR